MKFQCLCHFLVALSTTFAHTLPQHRSNRALIARIDLGKWRPSTYRIKPAIPVPAESKQGSEYGGDSYEEAKQAEPPYAVRKQFSYEALDVEEIEHDPSLDDRPNFAVNEWGDRVYILEYTEFDQPEMRQNLITESTDHPDKSGMVFTEGRRDGTDIAEIRQHLIERDVRWLRRGEHLPFRLDEANSYPISRSTTFGRPSNVRIYVKHGTERGFEKTWIDKNNQKAGLTQVPKPQEQALKIEDAPKPIVEEKPTRDTVTFPGITDDGELDEGWDMDALAAAFEGPDPSPPKTGKRDVINTIEKAGANRSVTDYQASYQKYLSAFETAQDKAIEIVFPFLEAFINGTNSRMVYDAAWSIYSELTFAPVQVIGPFTMGLGCMDWFEEKLFNGTNSTVDSLMAKKNLTATEVAMLEAVVVGWELQQAYQLTFNATLTALNSSGVLGDMITLSSYLMPNDTSLIPDYMKNRVTDPNTPFFTQWRNNTS